MESKVLKFTDPQAAAKACGARILELLDRARHQRGFATLAISGGSTPRIMFEWMAAQPFHWTQVELFWVDERCVPPDNDQSNFLMARKSLIDPARILPERIHRIEGELNPEEAARLYVENMGRTFAAAPGDLPVFDVIQRGMGPDGHTASLFPGEPLIEDRTGWAAAVRVEKLKQHRVTLLPGVLEKARHTVCLVAGSDKADALSSVLNGARDRMMWPAQISSAEMEWYVDSAAAARL